jgi:hypothetical protein
MTCSSATLAAIDTRFGVLPLRAAPPHSGSTLAARDLRACLTNWCYDAGYETETLP